MNYNLYNPYTVILHYVDSQVSDSETFLEWVYVNKRVKHQRAAAIKEATALCWKANSWTAENAETLGDIAVFPGHIQDI